MDTYSTLPLYKAKLHAVNYSMKYLCGEVLFCTLFIMKGMATWSTVLPGKKQSCKESDTPYHIYHIQQSYIIINLKIQELIHQNAMWSCFGRCHWWNGIIRIQSFNTRYSLDLGIWERDTVQPTMPTGTNDPSSMLDRKSRNSLSLTAILKDCMLLKDLEWN